MQFKDVLVAQEVKDQLLRQVHEHRISHAQFFLAQPGTQAFSLAVAMGQYLCCEHPSDTDSCGECPSCIQFSKLTHPDLHIYFPNCNTKDIKKDPDSLLLAGEFRDYVFKNNFNIDNNSWILHLNGENKQPSINIRDCSHIISQNSIRSYMGGYKIYILWNVDRLNDAAAPKLLKTLEEPEQQSLFILISEKPDQMLSTILSRTQLVKIPRLTEEQVAIGLQKDFPELTSEQANDIAILSEGNYIKAINIHKEGSSEAQLIESFSIMMNGVIAFAQQKPLSAVNYEQFIQEIELIAKNGREYEKAFIQLTLKMLHDILMINNGQGAIVKSTARESEILSQFKGAINLKQISMMTEECNKAYYHIARNCNANIVFADLFFKLANCMN